MAKINIRLKDIFGEGFPRTIIFECKNTPYIKGDALIAQETRTVTTDEDGEAVINLMPGQYRIAFANYRSKSEIEIGVPDDDGEYDLTGRINAGTSLPPPPVPQGPKGDSATISVGLVETLPPGDEATVENTGTAKDAVLKFGIPRGDKGDKGDKGDIGLTGPGLPAGGSDGQILRKTGTSDYSTSWSTPGTAIDYSAPASGNASASEVVLGGDTRLSDARTPTAHTHSSSQVTDFSEAVSGIVEGYDFATQAFVGDEISAAVNDLGLGTAASRNVPASGNASVAQVVLGTDTRLTNSRAPTAHQHNASDIDAGTMSWDRLPSDAEQAPLHAQLTGTVIDWARSAYLWKAISASTAFTFSNLTNARTIILALTTSAGASPSWPAGIEWGWTGAPVHPTNSTAVYTFIRIDGEVHGRMS